jgi:hypothetical protein
MKGSSSSLGAAVSVERVVLRRSSVGRVLARFIYTARRTDSVPLRTVGRLCSRLAALACSHVGARSFRKYNYDIVPA